MKKALIVITVAIMILTFASCGNKKAFEFKDKVVTYEDISLTLTEAFYPSIENYGSDMVYESGDVYVFIDREFHRGFHELEELDAMQYAEVWLPVMKKSDENCQIEEVDGLIVIEYKALDYFGKPCVYFVAFFKGANAFWMLTFHCPSDYDYNSYRPYFIKWAKAAVIP